jgi:pimeloyl-ACP methyl ester carboxylesterase
LSFAYPAGRASVAYRGRDERAVMTTPPRDVAGLLGPMAVRDAETWHARQGEVDVRVVTTVGADGRRSTSYVVHVLGTKDWQYDPRRRPFLNDLSTNLTAMAGRPTARIDGIATALRSAGARPGDPVMLVGHSQGGLVAMRAAQEWTRSGSFAVTHVLAAGSPSGAVHAPGSVQVLALESRQDVVVELDAADSPDRSNVTTVRFDSSLRGVVANHDLAASYLPAARALPALDDPSVRAWLGSAGAFLAADGESVTVRAERFDVRNAGAQ